MQCHCFIWTRVIFIQQQNSHKGSKQSKHNEKVDLPSKTQRAQQELRPKTRLLPPSSQQYLTTSTNHRPNKRQKSNQTTLEIEGRKAVSSSKEHLSDRSHQLKEAKEAVGFPRAKLPTKAERRWWSCEHSSWCGY